MDSLQELRSFSLSCEVHILLEESDCDEFCSELMFYGVKLCS